MSAAPELRRALGFRDLLLFYVATTLGLRWMATAAQAGPSGLVIWIVAAATFFVPLVFTTLELSSRYPQQGGIYIWAREAFGPFAGFLTAWLYWATNLVAFPSMLYFAAGNLLFVRPGWQALSASSTYFMIAALVGLAITSGLNVVGLGVGKALSNAGAVAGWICVGALVCLGAVAWGRFGIATPFTARDLIPGADLKDAIFWSTIAFAFGGVESASTMADEVEDPRRNVPRAIVAAAIIITLLYIAGTVSILVSVPLSRISGLQGIMQAIEAVTLRAGVAWLSPALALLIVLNGIGGVGGWFAAVARLPFVAGIDRFLPAVFARIHPVWRTPHVALITQAAVAGVFVVLGQAGTTVRGAYEVLVSMSIITYFVPFLFMFAAIVRVQRKPSPPGVVRVPGGPPVAIGLGIVGFATTSISIVLACIPSPDEVNPALAVVKIVGLSAVMTLAGVLIYALGRRRTHE